jgi:hypothetical protein
VSTGRWPSRSRKHSDGVSSAAASSAAAPSLQPAAVYALWANHPDHLKNTSYHNPAPSDSWRSFWRQNIDVGDDARCPCVDERLAVGQQHLMQQPVGAHVVFRGPDNQPYYGIVPVCNSCNRAERVIAYECRAVTIVDMDAQSFHGRIMRPGGGAFSTVTGSRRRGLCVEVDGQSSSLEAISETYRDRDQFIGTLADFARRGWAFVHSVQYFERARHIFRRSRCSIRACVGVCEELGVRGRAGLYCTVLAWPRALT